MNVVIIFDVSSMEQEIRSALSSKGFYPKWSSNGEVFSLPKACMWKPNTTISDAKKEFMAVIKELNMGNTLEKLLVLSASPWEGFNNSLT